VAREQKLPGLSAWGRVKDYRAFQLSKMPNVEIFYDSRLNAAQVLEFGFDQVLVATGATWRRDGVAHYHTLPMPIAADADVLTPDDLMAGKRPSGKTVTLYDDDHYYMGGVLAELLQREGFAVTLVTPATEVSNWARNTLEQFKIQARLLEHGVEIVTGRIVSAVRKGEIDTACVFTGRSDKRPSDSVVMVTARLPNDRLYLDLKAREADWADAGIVAVKCAGDAWGPATIAAAVYAGRRYAEEMDAPPIGDALPFKREITELLAE
jgi:dimethylamine/trimethylamine dehydrogenase